MAFVSAVLVYLTMSEVLGLLELQHLSTVYLPSGKGEMVYNDASVEQIAYDYERKVIYSVGSEVSHLISVEDDLDLDVMLTRYEKDMSFTDIDICGDFVFVTVNNKDKPREGLLRVYGAYDELEEDPWPLVLEVEVGKEPDMLVVRKDCRTAIVAVEAEEFEEDHELVDPEGLVVIVKFPEDMNEADVEITTLDFSAFNDQIEDLEKTGVRFIYREDGNQFSNDAEPEYVTVDEEGNKAYVTLQENNAIGVVDLQTEEIVSLHGLGYKDWGYLDASNDDGGIEITYWPIRGWYQPDSTKFHSWNGQKLIFTANEGAHKSWSDKDFKDFDETVRGLDKKVLSDEIHVIVRDAIEDEERLGRLKFSKYEGLDKEDEYEALYTYGGRSFAIWEVTENESGGTSSLDLVYDSDNKFEEITALHCPHLFNTNGDNIDDRSDNMGSEPETITLAEVGGRLYIFVGLERPGIILVYSIGTDDVRQPRFETIFCDGIPDDSRDVEELYQDRDIYLVDPEDIKFYPADESLTGRPLLVVAGTVSGTVSLLDVRIS